ncbi:GNAT family N-acetyltransferase [Cucumibacter marinus]|uniref:GNAT family N-acetyltransferase n=1 Tax=Cucumibacter marinus TaxID=1121252 RepID=UPI000405E66B|nr:GNAT family N-acetyltransferase [Cucumibacter marinus]
MISIPRIETERFVLRPWQLDDFEAFAGFYADPLQSRYVGGPADRTTAWRRFASLLGHWALKGFGEWAIEDRNNGALLGDAGLMEPDGWPEIEMGYWLLPEARGKGVVSEAAGRIRDHAFTTMGLDTLVSYIDPANAASKRVAEGLGAHYECTIDLSVHGPHEVYRYVKS